MRKFFAMLALMLLSPFAAAQFVLDGGTATCTEQQCYDGFTQVNFARFAIMNNLNCRGHGHTPDADGPGCMLSDNVLVKINLQVGANSEMLWFRADRIQTIPAVFQLLQTAPPHPQETHRVYYLPMCVGAYIDTYSYFEASNVEGGISFTIFTPPDEPHPGICWEVAVVLDP